MRKEIWKEFFRLKREEIGYFFKENVFVIYLSPIMLWVVALMFIVLPVSMFNEQLADTLMVVITIIMLVIYLCILLVVIAKWLHSNWKQAVRNVEEK